MIGVIHVMRKTSVAGEHHSTINDLYIGGKNSFGVTQSPEKHYITYNGVAQGLHILSGRTMGLAAAEFVYNNYIFSRESEVHGLLS